MHTRSMMDITPATPGLKPALIIVEPFCGGSHAALVTWLEKSFGGTADVFSVTLPAKKWHWRLRTSSLWAASAIPCLVGRPSVTLFVSSMCNLAELLGLRPDLLPARKVYYFHENQLSYPTRARTPLLETRAAAPSAASAAAASVRTTDSLSSSSSARGGAAPTIHPAEPPASLDRDFYFGWAQIVSCLAADVVAFNSAFNRDSFCELVDTHLRLVPGSEIRMVVAGTITPVMAGGGLQSPAEAPPLAPPPPPLPCPCRKKSSQRLVCSTSLSTAPLLPLPTSL